MPPDNVGSKNVHRANMFIGACVLCLCAYEIFARHFSLIQSEIIDVELSWPHEAMRSALAVLHVKCVMCTCACTMCKLFGCAHCFCLFVCAFAGSDDEVNDTLASALLAESQQAPLISPMVAMVQRWR